MKQRSAPFEVYAAERLAAEAHELGDAWAERVPERMRRDVPEVASLIRAAAPELLTALARFVVDDGYAPASGDNARETLHALTRLYRGSDRQPAELLREFESLSQVLDGACLKWIAEMGDAASPDAGLRVAGRLNRGPQILGMVGVEMFWTEEQAERETPAHQMKSFADTLGHELRTPLNAAMITTQLLEMADGRPSEVQQLVALIRRNLERADAVLRNVRTVVLHLPADAAASAEPFGQVLAGVLADVREELAASDVRLELEEPLPAHAVDAPPMRLILTNLLRNAIRYRDRTRPAVVRLSFRRRGADGLWWAEVADNGLGIPPEFQERVLRQVFRAHPEHGSGLGIGLTIVARAIEQMRADIEFESVPGAGTTFRFSLPEATSS